MKGFAIIGGSYFMRNLTTFRLGRCGNVYRLTCWDISFRTIYK